ncbi:cell division control protein 15, CDC15, putative [Entamoeba invadens IP1]|uniref:Cell division control protein 15, CDC15, putative n=1 Tax=Entamoeba invadens IP1 TaxID=370355 RepID=L7FKZ6_ENTIV|nr:cell division control protein 15, CDC15, putative [Entamoeba invadens IP1]ELP86370.1 cell division control protein 15, CDC15, putative [Entamoeba invadens IP1]|eukprot:XP_004185716.1 cell division control protein 15, CDC15, putative [Entamoeba invadens IP1]
MSEKVEGKEEEKKDEYTFDGIETVATMEYDEVYDNKPVAERKKLPARKHKKGKKKKKAKITGEEGTTDEHLDVAKEKTNETKTSKVEEKSESSNKSLKPSQLLQKTESAERLENTQKPEKGEKEGRKSEGSCVGQEGKQQSPQHTNVVKDKNAFKVREEMKKKENAKLRTEIETHKDVGENPMTSKKLTAVTDNEKLIFNIANSIGCGAYGEVFVGMNADSGEFVAIKQMKITRKSVMNEVMEEIRLLKKLKHKHIVRYITSTESYGSLYIVMEYMESGSLLNIIKKFNKLNEALSAKYVYQILDGLSFIHEQGIVHRDIKAANILVAKDGSVKIADFGVSVQTDNTRNGNEDVVGTPNWMSPEIIMLQGTTVKADIWALGCTVLELITGNPPYYDLPPAAALHKIVSDEIPPIPNEISYLLRDFLLQCFQKNPLARASSTSLQSHKWFVENGLIVEKKKRPGMVRMNSQMNMDGAESPRKNAIKRIKAENVSGEKDEWGESFDMGVTWSPVVEKKKELIRSGSTVGLDEIDVMKNTKDEQQVAFIKMMDDATKLIHYGGKENIQKLMGVMVKLCEMCADLSFKNIASCVYTVGVFPPLSVVEREEFNYNLPLKLTAFQVINKIIEKEGNIRKNIVMCGCATLIEFSKNHVKYNDPYLNEIVKFVYNMLVGEDAREFFSAGGLSLVSVLLGMKYDERQKGNIKKVLEGLVKFIERQNDVVMKIGFCSRNVISLLLIKDKVIEGLLQMSIQSFIAKNYGICGICTKVINQMLEFVVRNGTQVKYEFCQRIVSSKILETITQNMHMAVLDEGKDKQEYTQEEALFQICKTCKNVMVDSDKDCLPKLLESKIVLFLFKVLFRCDSVYSSSKKQEKLEEFMKKGIYNPLQCLKIVCVSCDFGVRVCQELCSMPSTFTLLCDLCEAAKSFEKIENDVLDLIFVISKNLVKQQGNTDLINSDAMAFILSKLSKKGLRPGVFAAISGMYLSNTKWGMKTLSDIKNIVYLTMMLNQTDYSNGECASELNEFSKLLNETPELVTVLTKTQFIYGVVVLMAQIDFELMETKMNFAKLVKLLILNCKNKDNIMMKQDTINILKESFRDSQSEKKDLLSDTIADCLELLLIRQNDGEEKGKGRKTLRDTSKEKTPPPSKTSKTPKIKPSVFSFSFGKK